MPLSCKKNNIIGLCILHCPEVNGPFVKVEDTAKAMLELSGYYRSKFNIPVVGLTGSVGKTTTKEFTHLVVNWLCGR